MKYLLTVIFLLQQLQTVSLAEKNAATSSAKNVILIVVDTFGAKHLSSYNKSLKTTPNIDNLAADGALFKNSFSTAPWTKPSIASTFTSLYPSEHRVTSLRSEFKTTNQTLAESLRALGYKTGGFVSHTLIGPKTGYARGFEEYEIVKFQGDVHQAITSHQVTQMGIDWLKRLPLGTDRQNGFFLFLHYFDPHYNYQHHAQFDRLGSYKGPVKPGLGFRKLRELLPTLETTDITALQALHHEEIEYTDQEIGKFLAFLKESNLDKSSIIVLTADHGEEFLEHGSIGHTRTLYNELVNIPLIFSGPGVTQGKVIDQFVSIVDIVPTLNGLLDLKQDATNWKGLSLKPVITDAAYKPETRNIFLEVDFKSAGVKAYKAAVIFDNHKLIFDKEDKSWEYYDLLKDPDEKNNLAQGTESIPETQKQVLINYLEKHNISGSTIKEAEADQAAGKTPEEIEQLKTLGYL